MTSPRWVATALAGCAVYLALAWRLEWLCDDAFISFRYARHLALGEGLAFNLGEVPPAEGYSNLLWVLALAPFEALGAPAPAVAPWLSALCGCALVVLLARWLATHLETGVLATAGAVFFLACAAPMSVWATGGLETTPFALALFGLLVALESEHPRRGVIVLTVFASALLRVDGPLWVAALLAGALLLGRGGRARGRAALVGLGALIAILVLHSGFRLAYHGDLVPNTVRIKGGLSWLRVERGLLYAAGYVAWLPAALLVPALGLGLVRPERRWTALRAAAFVAFGLAYAAIVGGDFLPMGRLLVPSLAPTAVLLALTLQRCLQDRRVVVAAALGTAAVLLGLAPAFDLHVLPRALHERLDFRWSKRRFHSELEHWRRVKRLREELEILARALARSTQPGEALVKDAVGVVGYRTELVIHDRFGLVDREVARLEIPTQRASPGHDRVVDARFFLDRRPDYLEAYLVPTGTPTASQVSPELVELVQAGLARVESHPLPAEEGFPEGAELRLVRLVAR